MFLGLLTGLTVMAAVALAGLAIYVWRRREAAAGLSLAVLLLSVAWWATAYALELSSHDIAVRGFWGEVKYVGITILPAAWLVFVLQYTGRGRLVTRRLLWLLAIEPAAVLTLLVIPGTRALIRYYTPETVNEEIPTVGSGPVFWVHLVYADALILLGVVLFVASMARLSREYRVAALILLCAGVLPWAANLLHNLEVGPFVRMDLTPFLFVVSGAMLVWGLFRQRLVNLSSVAWRMVVATGPDAVILRDAFGHISDVNPAGERILGASRAELVGRDLDEVLGSARLPAHPHRAPDEPATDTEIAHTVDGEVRYFDLRYLPLRQPTDAPSSELVMMRDITSRRESEQKLLQLLEERTQIAATLQASMRPARLPDIPGCELAAHYEAAGGAHEIGGDFYDVFRLGPGQWGVVLGDVSGKGVNAAATTSLIRYTLRTLALEEPEPTRVLTKLNDALVREGGPEQFCTVIYAVCRISYSGVHMRLCLAGHHPALVRRADGRVEPVGRVGSALGLFPYPVLHEVSVHLRHGDLLCLFTDGLTEARNGSDQFGAERVAAVLAGDASCPQRLLEQLAESVRDYQSGPLTDDVALLVVKAPAAQPRLASDAGDTEATPRRPARLGY